MRRILVGLLAVLVPACSRAIREPLGVAEPCSGHECRVNVLNHTNVDLTLRYADSTGRRELVGLLLGAGKRSFKVLHIHSAGIRLFAIDPDGRIFAADVGFELIRPTDVHFPDDFAEVADTLMPVRRRP